MRYQDNVFLEAQICSFLFFIQMLGRLRRDWEGFGLLNNSMTSNRPSLNNTEHYTIQKLFFSEYTRVYLTLLVFYGPFNAMLVK